MELDVKIPCSLACLPACLCAGLHPSFHDDVARFLAAMSPLDGVREALLLPGLTPAAEMALAIRCSPSTSPDCRLLSLVLCVAMGGCAARLGGGPVG
jgi:hypothetical protein